jgi:4-hydroxy-2-oxoglutarate aldolase
MSAFNWWLVSPLTGFVVLGSTGEAALLSDDESDQVIDAARQMVPSGRAFVVGTGRESTEATIRATRRAADLGADAVLVRTPGFYKAQMKGDVFVRHYRAVADSSPVPILLYNFTAVTGVDLQPSTAGELAAHPNIVGMKESGNDVAKIAELVAATPSDFSILAGSATTFFASLAVGATGGILALSCVLPAACVRLFDLMRERRHDEARALQERLIPLSRLIGASYGVPGLKAAMKLAGVDVGAPRPPLVPVPESAIEALKRALDVDQLAPI